MSEREPVRSIVTPTRLVYQYSPGRATSRFLRGIARGKLLGQRCPVTGKVYIPPRGASPTHGIPTEEEVEVADKGTVTTFCIVRVPSANIDLELPYVCAHILLDGADIPFFALIQECRPEDVHMGQRVEAVWVAEDELGPTFESIRYFRPIDEPDVPYEQFKEHL
jgi:uncharacterized OB-fold protein